MLWRLGWWTNQLTGLSIVSSSNYNISTFKLGKRPRLQEFRGLFYEDCQWRGVLGYVFIPTFIKDILSISFYYISSISTKSWPHWKVGLLRLTCPSPTSSLQRLFWPIHACVPHFICGCFRNRMANTNCYDWRVLPSPALYKGFLPCWLRMAPWSLTFWLSFEQVATFEQIIKILHFLPISKAIPHT